MESHRIQSFLYNLARIASPFLVGWFVASGITGAYRPGLITRPRAFMLLSAAAWLLGMILGLFLRATVFGEGFVPVFAAVTIGVTGVLLLGWRALFVWLANR